MPVFPPVTTATFPSSLLAEAVDLPENQPEYLKTKTVTWIRWEADYGGATTWPLEDEDLRIESSLLL